MLSVFEVWKWRNMEITSHAYLQLNRDEFECHKIANGPIQNPTHHCREQVPLQSSSYFRSIFTWGREQYVISNTNESLGPANGSYETQLIKWNYTALKSQSDVLHCRMSTTLNCINLLSPRLYTSIHIKNWHQFE